MVKGERGHGGTGESGTRNVRRKREGHKVAGKRQFKSRRKIKYIRSKEETVAARGSSSFSGCKFNTV